MKSKIIGFIALLLALSATIAIVWAQPGTEATPGKTAPSAAPILSGKVVEPKGASGPAIYIVQLQDAPLASYSGGKEGLPATAPSVTGERFLTTSAATAAYLDYLSAVQAVQVAEAEAAIGRPLQLAYTYQYAFNGYAAQMTPTEAQTVAALSGVKKVFRETIEHLDTDAGPTWIGAPGIWDGTATGGLPGTEGEGVVVAILDTGINSAHPSFAAVGGDGYVTVNPLGTGNYVPGSHCATTPSFCNDKLIGAWDMVNDAGDPNSPEDSVGHGSHTASTTAGNVLTSTIYGPTGISLTHRISGVAPHANIVAYDVCVAGCPGAALLAAVNQVIADNMYITANSDSRIVAINYSISGGGDPYNDAVELAFLDATAAGVFVSASAGNAGPTPGTVAHLSPWVMTTAASTHNRLLASDVVDMSGGDTAPPPDLLGQSFTTGYGPGPIVYAGDYGDPLCLLGSFPPGTFTNEIVVCDRGVNARVEKGQSVLNGGADGMILADNGAGINADAHVLPTSHISLADGVTLKTWLASGSGHMGTITGTTLDYDDSYGDIMAGFSSRGPAVGLDVLKPDITAPGVNIWAAVGDDASGPPDYGFMSGTSMSSPHDAGAATLLAALHPDWSPYEIKSALMTTSFDGSTLVKETGAPSTPFDRGSGRVDLNVAGIAGLVLDETLANFQAADPSLGGDLATLNIANLNNGGCFGTCSWTRTVSSTLDYAVTWYSLTEVPAGMTLTVEPVTFTLAAYDIQVITITANVTGLPSDAWGFGRVLLTASEPVAEPELEIVKDDGGISVYAGDDIIYTLTYTNTGDGEATGVVITDSVPANTTFNAAASTPGWTNAGGDVYTFAVGNLAAGSSEEIEFVVTVDSSTAGGSTITNVAQITGDGLSVGSSTDTTPVLEPPITDYLLYLPIIFKPTSTAAAPQAANRPVSVPAVPIGGGAVPDAHFPVAVYPVGCASPDLINIVTSETTGSEDHLICPETIEITDLTVVQHGLIEGTVYLDSLSQDPTNGDPYDNLNDGTVTFITVTVPADAVRIVAEVTESEAPDIDLYMGTGDTPSAATEECLSATGSNIEYCNINDPVAGTWWVLIQNWDESATPPDDVTLVYGVVPDPDAGNWTVSGPPTVTAGDPLTATISWNEPSFDPGEYWYGDFNLGSDPGNPGNVARVNVNFDIVDVAGVPIIDTDASSYSSTQASGEVVTFTATITNVGTADLTWSIDEAETLRLPLLTPSYPASSVLLPQVMTIGNLSLSRSANAVAAPATAPTSHVPSGGTTITHSSSQTITPLNSVSCNAGGLHSDNSYLRRFTLDDFGITDSFAVTSIDIGVEQAVGAGGTQPIEVRLYTWNPADPFTYANFTQIGSVATTVADQSLTVLNIPVTGVVPAGGTLVVEVFTPDGQTAGHSFFVGSNADPQTDASFIVAADCGIAEPTDTAVIGFPDMHIVMNVTGTEEGGTACDNPTDVTWLDTNPSSGTNAPGESTAVIIEFDATSLAAGDYSANLCINSNDPVTPQITVPVSMTVTGGPPVIELDPALLASTQPTDTVVVETLTISNTGGSDLDWSIDEAANLLPAVSDGFTPPGPFVWAPATEEVGTAVTPLNIPFNANAPVYQQPQVVLYDNGPLVNCAGCGAGGADASTVQTALLLSTLGFGHAVTTGFRVADDFTIADPGGWTIDTITFFAYQTGSTTTSTITGVNLRIWDGPPNDPGSSVVFGDTTTNILSATTWTGVYRATDTAPTGSTRPIMADTAALGSLHLPAGDYWLDWQTNGSLASGPWAPPITINGVITTGNGLQFDPTAGMWNGLIDTGASAQQGLPFVIDGSVSGGGGCDSPADIPWVSVNPTSGTTAAGGSTNVAVTFDSTGLATGVYTGTLCVNSNDPVTPLVEVPVELEVTPGGGGGPVTEVFTNTTPVAIPDTPTVTSTLLVTTSSSYLWDLNLTTFITHTFNGDLDMTLTSPSGTIVTISTDNGGGNNDVFNGTVWDDSANPGGQVPYINNNGLATDHLYANLTLASPLVPEEAFAAFIGEDPNGVWTLTIDDDAAADVGSLNTWSLELTTGPMPTIDSQTTMTNTTPVAIPDAAVITSTITVTGMTGNIWDVDLSTFIQHTSASNLDMTIMSPSGTIVTLSTDNGGSNDNVYDGTWWDDDADPDGQVPYGNNNGLVNDQLYVNLTVATPLVGEEALSAFNGEDPNGVWLITISDDLAADTGTLNSWSVDITTIQ